LKRRPRILIDALAYGPSDGGFTTALHDLLESCCQIEEFEFVVAHHARHGEIFKHWDVKAAPVRFPYKLRFLASLLLLPRLTRRLRADAVHCEISALPFALAVPGSVTAHDLFALLRPDVGGRTLGKRALTSIYWRRIFVASLRRARVLKAISETTAADVRRLIGETLPVAVVPPRIDAPAAPAEPRAWPSPAEPLRLLFLGSVVPRKNLAFLLRALGRVERDWRLDVVGNTWWGMSELTPALSDPRITVHGYVSDERREALLGGCDALVAPSLYEGFGYPVAEAMARGRLVLTSEIAAYREFVPPGCRFDLDDPAALARLIEDLDAKTYERLLPACRESVARFTGERHVERHRLLFQELTAA